MNDKDKSEQNDRKQTDAAEGERDTVEESIRIHEQRDSEDQQEPEEKNSKSDQQARRR